MSVLSDTDFGLSVLNQFPSEESIVFSPTSYALALALIHAGASGNTKEEIRKVLVGDASDDELIEFYKSTVASLKKRSSCHLKLETKLQANYDSFSYRSYRELKPLECVLAKHFSACIKQCYTFDDPLNFAEELNVFLNDTTKGTIRTCMNPRGSSFSEMKGMSEIKSLLFNTVYFEGKWDHKFFGNNVKEGDFYAKEGIIKKVDYMGQNNAKRLYAETDDVEVLTLPYKDKKYTFTIILPKERFGLKSIRSELTGEKLQELLKSVKETWIDLSIPKFKLEMESNATKILKALGVNAAFSEGAELEKFAKDLWINMVHHNAVVEINENGTKPGNVAFETVNCIKLSKPKETKKFVVDHPFLFFICRKSKIIFSGQFCGPQRSLWEPELYEPVDLKSTPSISSKISDNQFGLSFLKQLPSNESTVFSPTSIAFALALVHAGAKENVKQEIRKALLGDVTDDQLVNYYRLMYASIRENSRAVIRIANRIFIRNGFEVKDSYIANIAKHFAAEAENLNFNDAGGAAAHVNDFIDGITEGMISQCVGPNDFGGETNTMITNAIYFEGTWDHRFIDGGERNKFKFYLSEDNYKEVLFMSHYDVFELYGSTEDAEVLTLPYTDNKYTFTIILPKKMCGLADFRDTLTSENLQQLFKSVKKLRIYLQFPKFKIESEANARSILRNLGITSMFEKDADLEGIAPGVWISDVKHKAVIEVNENGTRAAGVTYVPGCGSYGSDPVQMQAKFKANHPFLYFIRREDKILFSGQYCG